MNVDGKQIINGVSATTGTEFFYAVERVKGNRLDTRFFNASKADIDMAVTVAQQAFEVTRRKSGLEKALFLEAIASELEKAGPQIVEMACLETALPTARIEGELLRTVNQARLFAKLVRDGNWVEAKIDTGDPDRKPAPRPDIRSMQRPVGPIAVFGASNFPLAFSAAGGDTVSAIAAGCPVIFKAHPGHPATSEIVTRAILAAAYATGMPAAYFSLLQGDKAEVGIALTNSVGIKAIAFTGSNRVGRLIFNAAAARPEPIPVFAEMGSSNPVFLLPQAMAERYEAIAAAYTNALTLGVGQFCTNPGMLIHESTGAQERFYENLINNINAAQGGVMLTDAIAHAYAKGVAGRHANEALELLAQGELPQDEQLQVPALFKTNLNTFLEQPQLEEELFGPSAIVVAARSKAEMINFAEGLSGHLTATVHGTEDELILYKPLLEILETKVGRLIINGYPTGVEVVEPMVHGGPYPATSDARTTSVGTGAIYRFTRPVCYQGMPQALLPDELKDGNPLGIWRSINGQFENTSISK
ncbi:aldehyde dehydrogenase (NADP(+)) [Mucilaginibacter sp. RS28]|uniref:Aldehyde dehydrogenase (NADP(+)) n=1 Tax=Mucilaginibacter straminoryzae TaxID=2932774 RepID=A0A9X2BAV2_9SPHI|nr:aldehyde dehydrogenase (NADP(+)) [Mucilaginibacter straminoryzae]MCJ8209192.1 aldehyde dehydrogenase (NADP(+)) [Mucilaginibacter straminoryzae]